MTAQSANPRPTFWGRATIQQTADGRILLRANDPRPLDQALLALGQEYGWTLDYEDPPYSTYELVDDTDPAWRESHPNEKGVTRVAGSTFASEFALPADLSAGSLDEERVINRVLLDYSASSNPGRFTLKKENVNRFSVVGVGIKDATGSEKDIIPVLDVRIKLPSEERSLNDTLELVLRGVSEKTGYRIEVGTAPENLMLKTKIGLRGEEQPARDIMSRIADASEVPLAWRLLYDADSRAYFMNLYVVAHK